jgi:hypothetical protein
VLRSAGEYMATGTAPAGTQVGRRVGGETSAGVRSGKRHAQDTIRWACFASASAAQNITVDVFLILVRLGGFAEMSNMTSCDINTYLISGAGQQQPAVHTAAAGVG